MLKKPARSASPTARPPRRRGHILFSVCAKPPAVPSELQRNVRYAPSTSPRMSATRIAPARAATATASVYFATSARLSRNGGGAGHETPDLPGVEGLRRQVGDDVAAEDHEDAMGNLEQLVEIARHEQ